VYFPNFLKLVLTVDPRKSKAVVAAKVLALLATQSQVELRDEEIFEKEGRGYLEFAIGY